MDLNKHFDNIYVLNLNWRVDRFDSISKRLSQFEIKFEKFNAVDGSVMQKIWKKFENPIFSSPAYLACAISHLSIWNDAQQKGYNRILILEDDVLINKNILSFDETVIPDWQDVLYLGWIPLSDDQQMWTYAMANQFLNMRILVARNFWGMFAYATTSSLRQELLEVYRSDFPMELDRYFVTKLQPLHKCLAVTPQLFSCQDIWSDNMNHHQMGMLARSVDIRFASLDDYV